MTGRLKIAMLGTRGLPATFGGVEHHVEQIGARLVERGHEVTVYSQSGYTGRRWWRRSVEHRGMRVVTLPTLPVRGFEALAHSALGTMRAMASGHDVFHYHAVGPGLLAPLPRYGAPGAVVQTIHGLDADRAKWGGGAQSVLRLGTWLSARVPDRTTVVARGLVDHFAARYGREVVHVPNGVTVKTAREPDLIRRHGLHGGDYVLHVGRLVPEKRTDLLVKAFAALPTDQKLVIAGGSSHTDEYAAEVHRLAAADPRVVLTGYVYGAELDELYTNATAFVQPSALEGLPLSLLEAVGSGLPTVVSDIEPHLEVVGSDRPGSRVFRDGDVAGLALALDTVLTDPQAERSAVAGLRSDTLRTYDWERCVDLLESLYVDALVGRDTPEHALPAASLGAGPVQSPHAEPALAHASAGPSGTPPHSPEPTPLDRARARRSSAA
jgi:glycosyltransferase involved in cell wall biosynthesis